MASLAAETTGGEIVVVFWPKHGLRSNLSPSNFPGGHASDPSSLFTLTHTLIRHHNGCTTLKLLALALNSILLAICLLLLIAYLGSFSWLWFVLKLVFVWHPVNLYRHLLLRFMLAFTEKCVVIPWSMNNDSGAQERIRTGD